MSRPARARRCCSFALRTTGNRHDANELVQRAGMRALERVHTLRADTAPPGRVFSTVHSIWLGELRQRNRRDRLLHECSDAPLETAADPGAASGTAVAVRKPFDAAERLPGARRRALLLVGTDGLG
nr:sigma factor [Burkholderia territorii]